MAALHQIPHQYPGHPDRLPCVGGDLGDRRPVAAQPEDHGADIAWRPVDLAARHQVSTFASIGSSIGARVRPPVSVYGRAGLGDRFVSGLSMLSVIELPALHAESACYGLADPVDQHRHLVPDLSDIT